MNVSIVPALRALKPAAAMIAAGLAGVLLGYLANAAFFPGTSPRQPIDFSHRIHAGDYAIPCLYCHTQARHSITAGVPSVNKCVSCHSVVATQKPQIRKVMSYWVNRQPIPWVKVHDLPDFVYFSHKRHVQADVACQSCHGPVETMPRVERLAPMKMGWCLECHKEHAVENGLDCWTCHK